MTPEPGASADPSPPATAQVAAPPSTVAPITSADPSAPSVTCRQDIPRSKLPPDVMAKPPKPEVKLGPQITNHIPAEFVQRVIRGRFACIRKCYENALPKKPDLAGRVSVKFVIERDTGLARQPVDAGSDLPDKAVIACVVDEFKAFVFTPAPEDNITVVYPIMFKTGS